MDLTKSLSGSYLLDLPYEIRTQIYELCFRPIYSTIDIEYDRRQTPHKYGIVQAVYSYSLLLTCRSIYKHAAPILQVIHDSGKNRCIFNPFSTHRPPLSEHATEYTTSLVARFFDRTAQFNWDPSYHFPNLRLIEVVSPPLAIREFYTLTASETMDCIESGRITDSMYKKLGDYIQPETMDNITALRRGYSMILYMIWPVKHLEAPGYSTGLCECDIEAIVKVQVCINNLRPEHLDYQVLEVVYHGHPQRLIKHRATIDAMAGYRPEQLKSDVAEYTRRYGEAGDTSKFLNRESAKSICSHLRRVDRPVSRPVSKIVAEKGRVEMDSFMADVFKGF